MLAQPSLTSVVADGAAVENVVRKHWRDGMINLSCGLPYWPPPSKCLDVIREAALEGSFAHPGLHAYNELRGIPQLVSAIESKLARENFINAAGRRVMVTAGANQAYVNSLMATCCPGEAVVIFAPYYFTHVVAAQLLGIRPHVVTCDHEHLLPDPQQIADAVELLGNSLKAVVLVSPGNPAGVVIPEACMHRLVAECDKHGLWVISDEAYEHFLFDDAHHVSPLGPNVINIFTMSKSYGMAGWRVGYMTYPVRLDDVMLKIQDTIPTHASVLAQRVAMAALDVGPDWVRQRVLTLASFRAAVLDLARGLHPKQIPSRGSLFAFVRLPEGLPEDEAVRILADKHNVLVLPGHTAGFAGYLRISVASLEPDTAATAEALDALGKGLAHLARLGVEVGSSDSVLSDSSVIP